MKTLVVALLTKDCYTSKHKETCPSFVFILYSTLTSVFRLHPPHTQQLKHRRSRTKRCKLQPAERCKCVLLYHCIVRMVLYIILLALLYGGTGE